MASTIKVTNINTPDGTGNITLDRPTVLQAGDIVTADIADVNVTTAKIADNAITLAKMAGGTDGQVITYDASGDPVAVGPGTDGQVLTSTGAGSPPAFEAAAAGGFTLGTEQATTSGSTFLFGSIPAGTKIIHILFDEVSLSGTSDIQVQIGDAGGLETSGYLSAGGAIVKDADGDVTNATDSFKLRVYDVNAILSGTVSLYLKDATNHDWISTHTMKRKTTITLAGGGSKSLSAELTQVQVMQAHSDTFNAGSLNILYL